MPKRLGDREDGVRSSNILGIKILGGKSEERKI